MDDFVCQCEKELRSACAGLPFYGEHEGKRYCVLHFPSKEKEAIPFQEAISRKIENGDFNFRGAYFSDEEGADFARVTFEKEADFGRATFKERANFRGAIFKQEAFFTEATFEQEADFTRITSNERAFFTRVTFEQEAFFTGATFKQWAFFMGTTFKERADFRGTFKEWATFEQATFEKRAWFVKATFEQETNFSEATFKERADFSGATFEKEPDFSRVTFEREAFFMSAVFEGQASFRGATFKDWANFGQATFEKGAFFTVVTFEKADFSRTSFKGWVAFSHATFKDEARFIETFKPQAVQEVAVVFRNARIDKPELLSFHTVWLRPSWFIDVGGLRRVNFTEVKWHGLSDGSADRLEDEIGAVKRLVKGAREQDAQASPHSLLAKACRELHINAEENRDYPTANEFHYWSMDALRKEGLRSLELIATLYWALSGYGERPRRALWVLVAMWAVFAVLYMLLGPSQLLVFSTSNFWESIKHAGQAAVYSLGVLTRLNPDPKPEPGFPQFLVSVEGILGPLQIALLALAIRRKVMR